MLLLTEIDTSSTGNIYPDSFFNKIEIYLEGVTAADTFKKGVS